MCETVELAPKRARGVVNGILRNAIRMRGEFEEELPALQPAVRHSCPHWLAERWVRQFGEETASAIMEWNTREPRLYARVNPLDPPDPIPADWEPLPELPGWFRINGPVPQDEVNAGRAYIADPSTRYSVEMLAPQAGESVLDACAAPGGKSVAMLHAAGRNLALLATDAQEHRLPALRQNLKRAAGREVRVEEFDWTQPCPEEWRGAYDAVLLDVPCSNTGVLQRRVDARWRLSDAEITRLAALQGQILENASAAVREQGRLVYSTCSIDAEEDTAVVQAFLAAHPEFTLEAEHLALPHIEQADGAYAALLRRR